MTEKNNCIGCGEFKEIFHITYITSECKAYGLCKECYQLPEPRFVKTERKLSNLINAILGLNKCNI